MSLIIELASQFRQAFTAQKVGWSLRAAPCGLRLAARAPTKHTQIKDLNKGTMISSSATVNFLSMPGLSFPSPGPISRSCRFVFNAVLWAGACPEPPSTPRTLNRPGSKVVTRERLYQALEFTWRGLLLPIRQPDVAGRRRSRVQRRRCKREAASLPLSEGESTSYIHTECQQVMTGESAWLSRACSLANFTLKWVAAPHQNESEFMNPVFPCRN